MAVEEESSKPKKYRREMHDYVRFTAILLLFQKPVNQRRLLPLAYQIYLWCLQVANKGQLPSVSALKCAYFSPVSLVSERVSSF